MAFDESITGGTTSKIIEVMVRDSTTGAGKTALAFGDVTASYCREGSTRTAITLASGTAGDAYSSGKWCEVDATNQKGLYQLHVPDAAIAVGVAASTISLQATGMIDKAMRLKLETPVNVTQMSGSSTAADNLETAALAYSATRGLSGTALPASAADAAGGLVVSDAGGLDIDAKLANTNEVTTARMAALTDWINGGRLDLLLDAVKAVTDQFAFTVANQVDANALTGGGGGTAPTVAQIRTEMDDNSTKLAAIVADTNELQSDDIPTTLATLATSANLATVDGVVDDIKVITDQFVFTVANQVDANALSGGSGGATAAAIADAVWDEAKSGHTTAGTFGEFFIGITKISQWLGLMFGKQTPDATALTEIQATGAGSGTGTSAADSQEAIRDRGDAGWTTGSVTGDAIITPLSASEITRVNGTDIAYFVGETISTTVAITDSAGAAVDVSAKTLRVVIDKGRSGHTDVQVIASGSITVGGAGNNQVTFTNSAAVTATAGTLRWSLRDTDDGDRVLARGNVRVLEAAEEDG